MYAKVQRKCTFEHKQDLNLKERGRKCREREIFLLQVVYLYLVLESLIDIEIYQSATPQNSYVQAWAGVWPGMTAASCLQRYLLKTTFGWPAIEVVDRQSNWSAGHHIWLSENQGGRRAGYLVDRLPTSLRNTSTSSRCNQAQNKEVKRF